MKMTPNFKSAVVIGAFNPMILTPDFLSKHCGFDSNEKPAGQTTPIASEIRFGDTHFLVELNKFQIALRNLDSFESPLPWNLTVRYLEVLQYTPLQMAGINLNYTLTDFNTVALKKLLGDMHRIGDILKVEPSSISLAANSTESRGMELTEVAVVCQMDSDIKNNIKFSFGASEVIVNNNFEVAGLDTDRQRFLLISGRHDEMIRTNTRFLGLITQIG